MTSVHIRVIAAEISRDCSHISAKVAQFTLIIVTSPNAERKFGVGVSRGPSIKFEKEFDGRMGTRRGGLLTRLKSTAARPTKASRTPWAHSGGVGCDHHRRPAGCLRVSTETTGRLMVRSEERQMN